MKPRKNPRRRPDASGRLASDAEIRRQKLRDIQATGSTEGIHAGSLKRFWEKGYLQQDGPRVILTKRGAAVAAGKIGAAGRGAVDFSQANHEAGKAGKMNSARGHAARAAALRGYGTTKETPAERRERLAYQEQAEKDYQNDNREELRALKRILPSYALKISPSDGSPVTREHLDDLTGDGWVVMPAGTVPAKVGKTLAGAEIGRPQDDARDVFWNPDPLGPTGKAHAVIVWSHSRLNRETVESFRRAGWDIASAPKRYREEPATVKNPRKNPAGFSIPADKDSGKCFVSMGGTPFGVNIHAQKTGFIVHHTSGKTAWKKALDYTRQFGLENCTNVDLVKAAEDEARRNAPGRKTKPKKNPSPGEIMGGEHASAAFRIALKKALEWFDNPELVTEPRELKGYKAPTAAVEIGEFIAIEYDSNKYDAKSRIYRHETEVKRRMFISVDGSTIIVQPPFKITKRGIEG